MLSGPFRQRSTPRHRAVGGAAHSPPRPQPQVSVESEVDELEVEPLARVQRSRLAFAVAITLAALPILHLDNATAETNETSLATEAGPDDEESSSTERARVAEASPAGEAPESTSTTAAPTPATTTATTAAPEPEPETATTAHAHIDEPSTTEEPTVQALQAPPATAPPPTAPPATAPRPTSPPTTAPARTGNGDPDDPATWDRLAQCESGGRWSLNTGNGYYGGLQFSLATWKDVGGRGHPHQASKAEQIKRGKILQSRAGWGPWPSCSKKLGF